MVVQLSVVGAITHGDTHVVLLLSGDDDDDADDGVVFLVISPGELLVDEDAALPMSKQSIVSKYIKPTNIM